MRNIKGASAAAENNSMLFATSPAAFVYRYRLTACCSILYRNMAVVTDRWREGCNHECLWPCLAVSTILLQFSFVSHGRRSRGQEGGGRSPAGYGQGTEVYSPPAFGACICMCSVSWLFSLSCRYLPSDWPE